MEERKIWSQGEYKQYEQDLAVVTITPPFASPLTLVKMKFNSILLRNSLCFSVKKDKLGKE